jgi:leucyl aminopeptidase
VACRSITCALFLQRFVTEAKSWLHVDIYGWTSSAAGAPRKAANVRPRARSTGY